jgi:hypothetical protein
MGQIDLLPAKRAQFKGPQPVLEGQQDHGGVVRDASVTWQRAMMSDPDDRPTEEPDPFDELRTGGEVAAFVYRKAGEDGLRALPALDVDKPLDREWIQEDVPPLTTVSAI